jgi:hypothetical protein
VNAARVALVLTLGTAAAAGVAMYYLQVYAFYREIDAPATYILADGTGNPSYAPEPADWRGIDADSSPIRYRACFTLPSWPDYVEAELQPYEDPRPPNAPDWFDCFDARAIGEALEAGEARAYLSLPNYPTYGIDEVVAVFPDGQAYAWRQINACGELVFDGQPAPEGCPPVPERRE